MRRWERWMVRGGVAVAVPSFLVATAMFARYQHAERTSGPQVDARWRELRAKYETSTTNDSARELEAIAREVGLDLAVRRFVGGAAQPSIPPVPDAYRLVGRFAEASTYDKDLALAASQFLQSHRTSIDRLIQHLSEKPVPRWPTTLDTLPAAYLPTDHLDALDDLLEADVIAREQAGDHAAAQRALTGLWGLRAALALRPDLAGRWDPYTWTVVRLLPWLEEVDPRWRDRVKEIAPHQAVIDAVELAGLRHAAVVRSAARGGELPEAFTRDYAIAMRETAAEMARHAPCAVDGGRLQKRMRWRVGLWNAPGHVDLPDIDHPWDYANSLAAWAEMAGKVLDLKARRDAAGGAWPATVPGIESSACVGARWSYSVNAEGAMTLAFSRGFFGSAAVSFTAPARPRR